MKLILEGAHEIRLLTREILPMVQGALLSPTRGHHVWRQVITLFTFPLNALE